MVVGRCRAVLMSGMFVAGRHFRRAVMKASGGVLQGPKLTLHANPGRSAQHCCSHNGLDWEQDCQKDQKPEAKCFHAFRLAQDVFQQGRRGSITEHDSLNVVTVARSSPKLPKEFLPMRLFHLACTAVLAAAPITAGAEIVNVAWALMVALRNVLRFPPASSWKRA
jgi:hypothetical protein